MCQHIANNFGDTQGSHGVYIQTNKVNELLKLSNSKRTPWGYFKRKEWKGRTGGGEVLRKRRSCAPQGLRA